MFADSHCHLLYKGFKDFIKERSKGKSEDFYAVEAVVKRAADVGVEYMVNIGTQLSDVEELTEISDKFPHVFRSIGIHPDYAHDHLLQYSKDQMRSIFLNYGSFQQTVAIGEIGLDYHTNRNREEQLDIFHFQLEMAEELNLPVSIHSRETQDETIDVLASHPSVTGVIHCFSGEREFADKILKTSFYFGIGGTLTFKKNEEFRETVKYLPLDRILLETDAPFLAPVPFRGGVNEPAMVVKIAEMIAELKNLSLREVEKQTTENFFKLFTKAQKNIVQSLEAQELNNG